MPLTLYPGAKDTWAVNTDGPSGDFVLADDVNKLQEAMAAVQDRLGANGETTPTCYEYIVKNAGSVDPGHKHSNSSLNSLAHTKLTYSGLTAGHALMAATAATAGFRQVRESDLANDNIFARIAVATTIAAEWVFSAGVQIGDRVKLLSPGGTGRVELRAPTGSATAYTYTFPDTYGSNGQVLTSNGAGGLSWTTPAGGGLPSSTNGATLRNNGSAWVDSTFLFNNGTNVGVNKTSSFGATVHVVATAASVGLVVNGVSTYGAIFGTGSGAGGFGVGGVASDSAVGVHGSLFASATGDAVRGDASAAAATSRAGYFAHLGGKAVQGHQTGTLTANLTNPLAHFLRAVTLGGNTISAPLLLLEDTVSGTVDGPMLRVLRNGTNRIEIMPDGVLRLWSTGGSPNWVGIQGPSTDPTTNVTYRWPAVDGSNDQVLTTNGSGVLSWTAKTGGGGSGDVLGPATSADQSIARFNGTDNKTIEASGLFINDSGELVFGNSGATRPRLRNNSNVLEAIANDGTTYTSFKAGALSGLNAVGTPFAQVAGDKVAATARGLAMANPGRVVWSSDATDFSAGSFDTGIRRVAAGELGITTGDTGNGGLRASFITLMGGTSGSVQLAAPAVAGSQSYTLPTGVGSNGQVLSTNGSGGLSWVNQSSSGLLSGLGPAAADNTIANGSFEQVWQWNLSSTTKTGMLFTESVAATGASYIARFLALAGSTAYPLKVVHPDSVTGRGFWLEGGLGVIKTRYLSVGPSAAEIPIGGVSAINPFFHPVGDLHYEVDGGSSGGLGNSVPRRFCAFYTNDLRLMLPKEPAVKNMFGGSFGSSVVYAGLHCNFQPEESFLGGNPYSAANFYGVDTTIEWGAGLGLVNSMISVGGEINFNGGDCNIDNSSGAAASFMAAHTGFDTNTGSNVNWIGFWMRGGVSGTFYTNSAIPHNIQTTGNTKMTGLHINAAATTGALAATGNDQGRYFDRFRPIRCMGKVGLSAHGPRIVFGQDLRVNINDLNNTAFWMHPTTNTTIPATVLIAAHHDTSTVVRSDYFILAGVDYTNPAWAPRFAFYREGGFKLAPQASPVEAVLGAIYVNSSDNKLYYHNGTSWVDLTTGGGGSSGGWQDDGTTVRLVTTSDKVVLGATSDANADGKHLFISQATGAPAIGIRHSGGSVTDPFLRFRNDGGIDRFLVDYLGGLKTFSDFNICDSNGSTRAYLEVIASSHTNFFLGGGQSLRGTGLQNGFVIKNGAAPSTSPADCFQMYSKDAAVGKAWPHFRAEDGVERAFLGIESVIASDGAAGVPTMRFATGGTAHNNDGFAKIHLKDGTVAYVPYWLSVTT